VVTGWRNDLPAVVYTYNFGGAVLRSDGMPALAAEWLVLLKKNPQRIQLSAGVAQSRDARAIVNLFVTSIDHP